MKPAEDCTVSYNLYRLVPCREIFSVNKIFKMINFPGFENNNVIRFLLMHPGRNIPSLDKLHIRRVKKTEIINDRSVTVITNQSNLGRGN